MLRPKTTTKTTAAALANSQTAHTKMGAANEGLGSIVFSLGPMGRN
jgi:hypothetical protein